mgnify:CR=1 FL=1|tara:strand:- start:754 stop:1461 length:708 start_codon:yes stop_codon:yes gene_type:complete
MGIARSQADIDKDPDGQRDATPVGGFKDQQRGFLKRGLADSVTGLDRVAGLQQRDDRFAGGASGHLMLNNDPEVRQSVTQKRKQERDFNLARREAIRRNDRLGAAMIGQHAGRSGLQLGGIRQHGADQRAAATGIGAGRIDAGQKYQSKLSHLDQPQGGSGGSDVTGGIDPKDYGVPSQDPFAKPKSSRLGFPDLKDNLDGWMRGMGKSISGDLGLNFSRNSQFFGRKKNYERPK